MQTSVPLPSPGSQPGSGRVSYSQPFPQSRPSPSPAAILPHHNSFGSGSQSNIPQRSIYPPNYNAYANNPTTPSAQQSNYGNYQAPAPRVVQQATVPHATHSSNAYNPPRAIEVYTLPDSAFSSIPPDIRSQFHCDEAGRVIFYTTPPLDANPIPEEKQALGHSLRYLADKARSKAADEKKRKLYDIERENEATERLKRIKSSEEGKRQWIVDQKIEALDKWASNMDKGTDVLYKQLHGNNWQEIRMKDFERLAAEQEEAIKRQKTLLDIQKKRKEEKDIPITGFKWI